LEASSSLTIDCAPAGHNGTATLTARLGNEVIAIESLNLTKPKQRTAFVAALCRARPDTDATAVEARLLQFAADAGLAEQVEAQRGNKAARWKLTADAPDPSAAAVLPPVEKVCVCV